MIDPDHGAGDSRFRASPLAAVMALGVLLRTLPWWPRHNLRGVLEYDDGVYYAAARLLLHGKLPYHDFTIVHPPGLSLVLLPAAGLGALLDDATGMAAARVEMQLFAIANIALVYLLARRLPGTTERRALLAALLYAVMPNAVSAEHTVLLEPLATTACLLASWLLLRTTEPTTRDLAGAGALLAVGVSMKLFAGAYVVAAIGYLLWRRRPRALLPLSAGGVVATAAVFGPFFLPDPGTAWHDVVVTQLSRPENPTVPQGLDRLVSMVGLGWATVPLGLLLLAVLLIAALRHVSAEVGFWLAIAGLMTVAFLTSPTYFLHYGEFIGPAVALLATLLLDLRFGLVPAAAMLVSFTVGTGIDTNLDGQADLRAATTGVPEGACVYVDAVSLALAADVYRDPSPACPSYVDGRGVALTQNPNWDNRISFYPKGFAADERWQAATRDQIAHAGWLLLRHGPASFPEWDATTRSFVLAHFRLVARDDRGRQPFQLWERI